MAFVRAVVRVEGEEVSGWSEIALLDLASGEIRSLASFSSEESILLSGQLPAKKAALVRGAILIVERTARPGASSRCWRRRVKNRSSI